MLNEDQMRRAELLGPTMFTLLKQMLEGCDVDEPASWDSNTINAMAIVQAIENKGGADEANEQP